MLEHGGGVRLASVRYGIPVDGWLDLSTGINPRGWSVPPIPASCWARLPQEDDGLEQAACGYYECEHLLPVAGSQAAIQALPRLRSRARVATLSPGYAEHRAAWQGAGHEVIPVAAADMEEAIAWANVVLLIHPNNPTGARFSIAQLREWQQRLATRGDWLIVDEAFMDPTPDHSLCRYAASAGLVVLRSLGKFFGLAGARVGFVCAQPELLARLQALLGPWSVNGPARWVATAALRDRFWQRATRQRLERGGARLKGMLIRHGLDPDGGCALFQWLRTPRAQALHEALARQGILTRLFTDPSSLRFGLPGLTGDWARLDAALTHCTAQVSVEAPSCRHVP